MKYAILHLFAGIELLLKARLQEEHWSLLFARTDDAKADKLETGDFRSVDFETCCQRLKDTGQVEIEHADLDHLNELKKIRNRIQHFGVRLNISETKSLVVKGIDFALRFFKEDLPGSHDEHFETIENIVLQLRDVRAFVDQRLKTIAVEIKDAPLLTPCPRCWQNTMVVGDGSPKCVFCGLESNASDLSQGAGEAVEECPDCGEETLVLQLYNNDDGEWVCYSCAAKGDYLSECSRCGAKMFGDGSICRDCFSNIVNKND